MALYAYIDLIEFSSYCVIQEEYGVIYEMNESCKKFLKNIGTPAILNEKDSQVYNYGTNYFWIKIENGWCVKYRLRPANISL